MKRMKRILLPICLLGCMAVSAQRQEGFDFNAFRAEVMERRAERLATVCISRRYLTARATPSTSCIP